MARHTRGRPLVQNQEAGVHLGLLNQADGKKGYAFVGCFTYFKRRIHLYLPKRQTSLHMGNRYDKEDRAAPGPGPKDWRSFENVDAR